MSFSIHYRSTETMHPAQAYAIKQHAEQLVDRYSWNSCEPVTLHQRTDGYLIGFSKPSYYPAEIDVEGEHIDGVPDGTVVTLAEVLCVLSREHGVNWDIGHDFEPDPIGTIADGSADSNLIEQLETVGSIGDLFDEMLDDGEPEAEEEDSSLVGDPSLKDERDDEGPRLLKFPRE